MVAHLAAPKAAPPGAPALLAQCCRSGRAFQPEGELRMWLRGLGWVGGSMTANEARTWLGVYARERALHGRMALPHGASGRGGRRAALHPAFAVGRRLFASRAARPARLRDAQGLWHEGPEALDTLLWRHREGIWASCPPLPGAADALLGAYFRHRAVAFPRQPTPTMERMMGYVLAPGGSAPGIDNEPY